MEVQSTNELIFELSEKLKYILERKEALEKKLRKDSIYLRYLNVLEEYDLFKRAVDRLTNVKNSSAYQELDNIAKKVCEYYDTPFSELSQKGEGGKLSRDRPETEIRHKIYFIANYARLTTYKNLSFKDITVYYFGQDHATMVHAVKTVRNLFKCPNEKSFREDLIELCTQTGYLFALKNEFNL